MLWKNAFSIINWDIHTKHFQFDKGTIQKDQLSAFCFIFNLKFALTLLKTINNVHAPIIFVAELVIGSLYIWN